MKLSILILIALLTFIANPSTVSAQSFRPIQDANTAAASAAVTPPATAAPSAKAATEKPAVDKPADKAETSVTPESSTPVQKGIAVSGVVRAVRGFPTTEVFFKDKKDSYFIDPTSSHDQIMNACLQSSRDGSSVSLRVDPVSHHVYSLSEQNKTAPDQSSDSSKMSRGGAD
jgi:hypothetical protein